PYVKYGGLRFVEAAHVKDLLALLRLLDNPWDEMAWFRVVRLLEGVGPATAARVLGQLGVRRGAETASDAGATSPPTALPPPAPARRRSTTTGWSSPPSTRPRVVSGTWCTSSTPPTACSRPIWPPATRVPWPRSGGCSTSRSRARGTHWRSACRCATTATVTGSTTVTATRR